MKCNVCGADMISTTGGNYYCPKNHIEDYACKVQNCDMPLPQGFGVRYGWICPRCGKVNSPDTRSCDCSSGGVTVTAGNTISIPDDIKISLSGIYDDIKVDLSGTITGGSAPEAHFNKTVYVDGGTVIDCCKINPEDFSTTTNTDSIVTLGLDKIKKNNK